MTAPGSVWTSWASTDTSDIQRHASRNIRFSSPAFDYTGRDAVHILTLIPRVLSGFREVEAWSNQLVRVTFFQALCPGKTIDGVLREEIDGAGETVEARLLLRPFASLKTAMACMQQLLEVDPVPSECARPDRA